MIPRVDSHDFAAQAGAALRRPALQRSLAGLRAAMPGLRAAALAELPDYPQLRARARDIRDAAIGSLGAQLLAFESQVTAAGGSVHWARDAEEACRIVGGICAEAGARHVIKSKSMVTEEIALNDSLQRQGLRVTETDLGEYIIQLRGERPSHILAPALHLGLAEVAATFEHHHQRARAGPLREAQDMLAEARSELRSVFLGADVGITGANFLVAETGSAVIVTNEGNADLAMTLPATHIVVTGIEKVVATLDDLGVLLRLLARSAIGEQLSAYTTLVQGPRQDGDASGPRAFHVVLVDNGRSALLGTPQQPLLRCIRCSACLNHCPVYTTVGGHAYGSVYSGPIGAALAPALAGTAASAGLPGASTLCGRCEEVCPVAIPIPDILRHWRTQARSARIGSAWERRGLRVWRQLAAHPWMYGWTLALLARLLRLLSVPTGPRRRLRGLGPLGRGWFAWRDLPAPDGETFQERWRRRRLRERGE